MDFRPPPPRPPVGSSGASGTLRKQALMGAHRTTSHHVHTVLEDSVTGAEVDQLQQHGPVPEHSGSESQSVQLKTWNDYWDSCESIEVAGRGTFTVYTAGAKGAVVFCLHGGGYTGLTWSLIAQQLKDRYRVVAPDLRGHGSSSTDNDLDFSAETMTQDIVGIWKAMFGGSSSSGSGGSGNGSSGGGGAGSSGADGVGSGSGSGAKPEPVPTLLVGHSMGGALAVRAAATRDISGLDGVVVIDVVEGTAIAALPHMGAILQSRPQHFASQQAAADWAMKSGTCKRREAAGVSFPSQVVPCTDGSGGSSSGGGWRWRTPLEASEPYWEGWYKGLSGLFLGLPVPKMLLLAGTDRLDKDLTIGQMQGKFQLVLMPTAGHAIQEDEPERTAEHVAQFLHRFRIGEPPMVIPRAAPRPGVGPVLPIVAGPLHAPGAPATGGSGGGGDGGGS